MSADTVFNTSFQNNVPVVRITGELDHYSTPRFRTVVADLIEKGCRIVVVDMSSVDFMDSGGMSGIIFAAKRLMAVGGHLSIAGCTPRIARKLDIGGLTKMPEVLTMHASVDEAVQKAQQT